MAWAHAAQISTSWVSRDRGERRFLFPPLYKGLSPQLSLRALSLSPASVVFSPWPVSCLQGDAFMTRGMEMSPHIPRKRPNKRLQRGQAGGGAAPCLSNHHRRVLVLVQRGFTYTLVRRVCAIDVIPSASNRVPVLVQVVGAYYSCTVPGQYESQWKGFFRDRNGP